MASGSGVIAEKTGRQGMAVVGSPCSEPAGRKISKAGRALLYAYGRRYPHMVRDEPRVCET